MIRHAKKILFTTLILTLMIPCFIFFYQGKFGTHILLHKNNFNQLPNWAADDHTQALASFQQSCTEILKRKSTALSNSLPQSSSNIDWQNTCIAAMQLTKLDANTAKKFFESHFTPYRITNNFNPYGTFTGYYLPLIHGSLKNEKNFTIPIYGIPKDLISINLGLFNPQYKGKRLIAQLQKNTLHPYPSRNEIDNGAIQKSAPVLLWGDNLVDIFFAQIQGSAIVEMPNKQQILIGYAGENGQPYTAIGKVLLEKHAIEKKDISMQTIRTWLLDHPTEIKSILNNDASFVFFTILKNKNPLGAEHIPLTPERSLAVDTHFIPLGTPLWLDTTIPNQPTPYQHLLIAQDKGGAIKGAIRGDVFWGTGDRAAYLAGHMNSKGKYWMLLPNKV